MTYALPEDVAAVWRPLSIYEEQVAQALIAAAERRILVEYSDVPARIEAGALDAMVVADIEVAMVKRAMLSSASDGIESSTMTSGPFSVSQKASNPDGSLYLTAADRAILSGSTSRARAHNGWLV